MMKDSIDKAGLSEAEQSRREFMKVAGKLAVYTPPALMLLMRPTPNAIAASAGYTGTTGGYQEDRQGELVGEASEQDNSYHSFWFGH
jgi:hypothetical protein